MLGDWLAARVFLTLGGTSKVVYTNLNHFSLIKTDHLLMINNESGSSIKNKAGISFSQLSKEDNNLKPQQKAQN